MDTNAHIPLQRTTPIPSKKNEPEEYIRTFEKDMATLKKGGVPDLTLFIKDTPTPSKESFDRELPIIPIQTPLSIQPKIKISTPPPPQAPLPVLRPKPAPLLQPEPPRIPPPPPPVEPLETYANDFSDKMKETHASTATVLAAEQDSLKQTPQKMAPQESSHTNISYIIAGVIFLIAGIVGAYVAYTYYEILSVPIILAPHISAPIFFDESEQVSGEGTVLLQAIEESISRPIASGAVRLLSSASTTTTDSIFSLLHTPAPDILLRNTQAAGSMAGVVFTGGGQENDVQSPFFILSVSSYSGTFSGMLSWETAMPRDLGALFPAYSFSSSTTPISNKQPGFRDEVISNHDVRIYRDATGRGILLYGYWNQRTLILARDPLAFNEIVQRLATSRAQY